MNAFKLQFQLYCYRLVMNAFKLQFQLYCCRLVYLTDVDTNMQVFVLLSIN
jgi:hypothetical protein